MTTPAECPICFEKKTEMIKYHGKDAAKTFSKDGHESCSECWTKYVAHVQWNAPYDIEHVEMERKTGLRPLTCPFCRDVVYHIDVQKDGDNRSQHDSENRCVYWTMSCAFYSLSFLSCCLIMT